VTKYKSIKIVIRRHMLLDELVKNRTLLTLLNVFNVVKDGYFGAVFIIILRALASSERRIRVLLKKRAIE
jgi:hypothetical protein